MRVCKYLSQRVKAIAEQSEKYFKGFSNEKKNAHEEIEFYIKIQD